MTYNLDNTSEILVEAINRLAAIAALPDPDIGAALDTEIDAERDIGDLV